MKPSRLHSYIVTKLLPRFYWKNTVQGKYWAFGAHNAQMLFLADGAWKRSLTKAHPTEHDYKPGADKKMETAMATKELVEAMKTGRIERLDAGPAGATLASQGPRLN